MRSKVDQDCWYLNNGAVKLLEKCARQRQVDIPQELLEITKKLFDQILK